MTTIIDFPKSAKSKEPMDDVTLCTITITGDGDGGLWVSNYIETSEQFNWLIAKITAIAGAVIDMKNEAISNGPRKA